MKMINNIFKCYNYNILNIALYLFIYHIFENFKNFILY